MIHSETKRQNSLLKRRKRAIIIVAAAILLIAIATVFILDYANSFVYVDPADGTEYYIKKRSGSFGLYTEDGVLLEIAENYSSVTPHYITAAGTLVQVNPETGAYSTFAVVDTEDTEVFQLKSRLQIFPHITKANLMSVEIHNSYGSFTFQRMNTETGALDASQDFALKESPSTSFDQTIFATLYVSAGNSLTLLKLQNPDVNQNGLFEEYGLVAETRTDENGEEYWYEPSYYIVTAIDGTKHKIIVGDRVIPDEFTASDGTAVTLGGYYVQYAKIDGDSEVKRNAVYILDQNTNLMLSPIEDFITPFLTYPMTSTDYYNVENFKIQQLKANVSATDSDLYDEQISFSYIDMAEREDTLFESTPFRFHGSMSGYTPSSTTLDHALACLYSPTYVQVCKFLPTEEDLTAYGLFAKTGEETYEIFSKYMLSFDYIVKNQSTNELQGKIRQIVLISEKNEDGNYYAYTYFTPVKTDANGNESLQNEQTYQMIVEIEGSSLAFLEWERLSWISTNFIDTDICFVKDITIETPDADFSFVLDNSLSDYTADMRTANLIVNASNSFGKSLSTFGRMAVTDKYGYTWYITTTGLEVYSGSTKMEMESDVGYYANNALNKQARCRTGYIECNDYRVEVNADTVRILHNNGKIETLVRYSTTLFRYFYETLVYTTVSDSYTMTEEEEAALLNDPNAWLMTITLHADDEAATGTENATSVTKVFRFYRISSRKAYITINGEGGFYVLTSRLEKIVSDAQKFFDMQTIDPTAKS